VPQKKQKIIFITLFLFTSAVMPQLTPNEKHDILTLYSSNDHRYTKKSLSEQYNIKGGRMTISRWLQQWDGTPESLERKESSGRPTLLTSKQIRDTIQLPIRNKNRSSQPIHYPDLLPSITKKTGKKISVETIRRIGREQLGIKQKRTNKRTTVESKHTHTFTF
jgi:transposase